RTAARRPHERPPAPVGDDPDRNVTGAEQDRQPLDGVRRPASSADPGQRMGTPRGDHAEPLPRATTGTSKPSVAATPRVGLRLIVIVSLVVVIALVLIAKAFVGVVGLLVEIAEVGADRDVVLLNDLSEGLRESITDDQVLLPIEDIMQQRLDDLM